MSLRFSPLRSYEWRFIEVHHRLHISAVAQVCTLHSRRLPVAFHYHVPFLPGTANLEPDDDSQQRTRLASFEDTGNEIYLSSGLIWTRSTKGHPNTRPATVQPHDTVNPAGPLSALQAFAMDTRKENGADGDILLEKLAPINESSPHYSSQTPRHFVRDVPTTVPALRHAGALLGRSPPPSTLTSSLICHEDDPLRALLRFSTDASTFCPMYLSVIALTLSSPTDISQYNPATVSSACSCFLSHTQCCPQTSSSWPQPSITSPIPINTKNLQQLPSPQTTYSHTSPTFSYLTLGAAETSSDSTLVNDPVTSATLTSAHTNHAKIRETSSPTPEAWNGGGDVPAPALVAAAVSPSPSRSIMSRRASPWIAHSGIFGHYLHFRVGERRAEKGLHR